MKGQQTGLVAQVLLETTYYSLPSDTLVVTIPKLFNFEWQGQLHDNAGHQNVRELVANASLLLSFQDVFCAKILSFLKQIAFSRSYALRKTPLHELFKSLYISFMNRNNDNEDVMKRKQILYRFFFPFKAMLHDFLSTCNEILSPVLIKQYLRIKL